MGPRKPPRCKATSSTGYDSERQSAVHPISIKVAALQGLTTGDKTIRELVSYICKVTNGLMVPPETRVYLALRELLGEGFVETSEGDQTSARGGGRAGRYYSLTAAGGRRASTEAKALAGLVAPTLESAGRKRQAQLKK